MFIYCEFGGGLSYFVCSAGRLGMNSFTLNPFDLKLSPSVTNIEIRNHTTFVLQAYVLAES